MRKSLILFMTAIGGGAGYAASVTPTGLDANGADPATWRWRVSSILADQTRSVAEAELATFSAFDQRHMRYSPLGLPQATWTRAP